MSRRRRRRRKRRNPAGRLIALVLTLVVAGGAAAGGICYYAEHSGNPLTEYADEKYNADLYRAEPFSETLCVSAENVALDGFTDEPSLHAAGLLKEGNVISRDLTDSKTALIEENSRRCNCSNIRIETFDALEPDENMIGKADVVYADLPCSGLGILGKKRDIRYRLNPEQMKALVELQQKILSVIWQYVKPG